MSKLKLIKDGFANIIKGLGQSKDPRQSVTYQPGILIDQATANNLYTYNWLAAKVADIPIDDATRKWRSLIISDASEKEKAEDVLKNFDVKGKINLAMKWARVFGGSAIVIVINGDDPEEELVIEKIRKDSLVNLAVLDRYNITPGPLNRDILSKNFNKSDYYTIARGGSHVHHSRVIKFDGLITTLMNYEQSGGWGESIFTRLFEPISDAGIVTQSISNLIYESNIDVYKIEGLNEMVAEGSDETVIKRLKIANEMKSIINGIVLDKEDDYDKKSNTFTTLDNIDDRYSQKTSGAADIPMTRIYGVSPSGMNATGESDMLNYHDNIQSIQENVIRPRLELIDKIISMSAFGDPYGFDFEFLPLKQLTEAEQADVDDKKSQTHQRYMDMGVINDIDVLSELSECGTYNTIDENRVEEVKKAYELDIFEEENEEEDYTTTEESETDGEGI